MESWKNWLTKPLQNAANRKRNLIPTQEKEECGNGATTQRRAEQRRKKVAGFDAFPVCPGSHPHLDGDKQSGIGDEWKSCGRPPPPGPNSQPANKNSYVID
ncbi:hypothetical protein QU487_11340 [Crenobacter sp. SG2305]|uniref:hypothetical protein n=1 Tax=Crenobacter oryzisoli TaxID=3056844 RepID=UPI0025AB0C2E|nr:hypothetical protein [Crenobacter sp. SG2305]MDN0083339.1 hypothetical protein [Crenobacter sp. SG2305]